jgi:hypothetical protein
MANETTRTEAGAQGQATNEQEQDQKFLDFLESNPYIDPWSRRLLKATIEHQHEHNAKPRFAQYLDAFNSVRDEDLIPPDYKPTSIFDSQPEQEKKRRFNEHLARVSKGDRLATAVGKAAGIMPFSILSALGHPFGGIGAGMAMEKAIPVLWDKLKNRLVKNKMKDDALSHFTGRNDDI